MAKRKEDKSPTLKQIVIKKIIIELGAVLMLVILVLVVREKTSKTNTTNDNKQDTTNDDTQDITNDEVKNNRTWTEAASNEQIIYIAPKDVYEDDIVVISVAGHVNNQLLGQGIRFNCRNKSSRKVQVTVNPSDGKCSDDRKNNKTDVAPDEKETMVLYLGQDAEPFTEGTYVFTIKTKEDSYTTENITIKAE